MNGCISVYNRFIKAVFVEEYGSQSISGTARMKARFDSGKLKGTVEDVMSSRGVSLIDAFHNIKDRGCHI